MMVANSFDLWQKDVFFSAAEEVQESADIMESAYRLWIKEKSKGRISIGLTELCKELQAALGTAKWQLEEFERAVRLSNGRNCRDDTTLARHKQFVSAIENQINRVESSLQEALTKDGKQPLRWVDLNEEERDDLAMFLSGSSQTSDSFNSESINSTTSSDCVIDIEKRGSPGSTDPKLRVQTDKTMSTRRTWSSPNVPTLTSMRTHLPIKEDELASQRLESTPKEKGSKQRSCNHLNQTAISECDSSDSLAIKPPNSAHSFINANVASSVYLERLKPANWEKNSQEKNHMFVYRFLRIAYTLGFIVLEEMKRFKSFCQETCLWLLSFKKQIGQNL